MPQQQNSMTQTIVLHISLGILMTEKYKITSLPQ